MKEGWQSKKLSEICNVDWGNTALTKSAYLADGEYLAVSAAGCDGRIGHKEHDKYTPVLSAIGAQCGRMFLPEEDFTAIKNTITLTPRLDLCTRRFLYYLLTYVELPKRGSAQPFIAKGDIESFQVLVPPLSQQQRIVALLDEAFAGLATAKANAERNLQNARLILENHIKAIFSQREIRWDYKRLEEVCGFQNGFAFKSNTFKPYGCPILRISNIQEGRVDASSRIVFFDPSDYAENLDKYRVVKGDLLIAMSGATTGKLGFNADDKVYYLNQRVGKFVPSKQLDPRFLYYFLCTRVEENLRISAGSAQPNLSTEQIRSFLLPLPSIDEQVRIVSAIDKISQETQSLTYIFERKNRALEELRQALLRRAFNGEL